VRDGAALKSTTPPLYALHTLVSQVPKALGLNNNTTATKQGNLYGAVIMLRVIARVHPIHAMNAETAPGGR